MQTLRETSTILNGDIDLALQLSQWVEEKFCWQLCYRASDDGWRAEDFHRECDYVGPTVTLVKCKDSIFGGYTDQSWKRPHRGILKLFYCNQMATVDLHDYSTIWTHSKFFYFSLGEN